MKGITIKNIPAMSGELYMTAKGRRFNIADFVGEVQINEYEKQLPILGRLQKGTKSIHASFIICGDIEFKNGFDFESIHSGKVFEATAIVNGEKIVFAGLRFEDFEPIKNELIFEITDLELIEKLLVS